MSILAIKNVYVPTLDTIAQNRSEYKEWTKRARDDRSKEIKKVISSITRRNYYAQALYGCSTIMYTETQKQVQADIKNYFSTKY